MTQAQLAIIIKAVDQASGELARVKGQLGNLGAAAANAQRQMGPFGSALKGIGTMATGVVGGLVAFNAIQGVFGGLSESVIGLNARLEQSAIAWETMLGSAGAAKVMLDDLKTFAAKTPFEFPELEDAARRMLAMGFAAQDILPMIEDIGNASAALGLGSQGIDRITLALGQMQAKAKVSGEEMRQLTEAGVPAWRILSEATGKTTAEVMKMSEKGEIAAGVFIDAFRQFSQQNYGDMMAKQAKTFDGAMATISDSISLGIATAFKPLFDVLSQLAIKIADFVQTDDFERWMNNVASAMNAAVRVMGRVTDSIGNLSQTAAPALKLVADNILWLAAAVTAYLGVQAVGALVAWGSATVTAVSYQLALFRMMGLGTAIMNTWIGSVLRGAASLVTFAVTGTASALTGLSQFVTMLARNAVAALASFAVAVYTRAVAALAVFAATGIKGVITAGVSLIVSLGRQAIAFALTGRAAVVAAGKMVMAWVVSAVPAIIGGAVAVATAIAGVAVPLLAVAAVVGAFALAWQTNFGNIQEIVTNVVNWIGERLNDLFGWLKSLPVVGQHFAAFGDWMGSAGRTIGKAMGGAGKAIEDLIADAKEGFPAAQKALKEFLGLDFEPAVLGMGDFRVQTEGLGDAIEGAGDAASQFSSDASPMKSALDSLKERANTLKDALSTAKDRLRELVNMPIRGEKAFDDRTFNLQQKLNALRLKETNLQIAKAPERTLKPIREQIDKLQLQIQKVDLEKGLKFDPLRKRIKELGEAYEEMPFGKIVQGIQQQRTEIGLLEPKLSVAEELWKRLEGALKDVETQANSTASALATAATAAPPAIARPTVGTIPSAPTPWWAQDYPIDGFQHGGSFVVGGYGGPDSQLIQFLASPRERVTISTPGQTPGITINGPLVDARGSVFRDEGDVDRLVDKMEAKINELSQKMYGDLRVATGQGSRPSYA